MGAFNLLYTYMVGSIEIVEFYERQISVCSTVSLCKKMYLHRLSIGGENKEVRQVTMDSVKQRKETVRHVV